MSVASDARFLKVLKEKYRLKGAELRLALEQVSKKKMDPDKIYEVPAYLLVKDRKLHKPGRSRLKRLHFAAQDGKCAYCDVEMWILADKFGEHAGANIRHVRTQCTLDEIFPRSRGGKATPLNTCAACFSCNGAKNDELWSLGVTLRT